LTVSDQDFRTLGRTGGKRESKAGESLYPWFTFRFADDRLSPRFHLEGIEAGRRIWVLFASLT
jgi:hypothetical protein